MNAAAQRYLASFPASEQQRIRDSWGGADLGDQWLANAVAAGAVGPDGTRRDPNSQEGGNQSTGVTGASGLQRGQTPTPAQLRQYAREQGWSEDFDRFNDATLASWISNNWDPGAMKFTTEKRDASGNPIPGYVEKPVDTPEGWTAWGSGAIPTSEANSRMAGWGGGPAASGGGASAGGSSGSDAWYTADPLQAKLMELYGNRAGAFTDLPSPTSSRALASGGIMWSTDPNATAANPFGDASAPSAGAPVAPWGQSNAGQVGTPTAPAANPALVSATLNAFTPQAPSAQAAPAPAATPAPAAAPAAPTSTNGGLRVPTPQWSPSATTTSPTMGASAPAPAPAAPTTPLEGAVARRYTDPNKWWANRPSTA